MRVRHKVLCGVSVGICDGKNRFDVIDFVATDEILVCVIDNSHVCPFFVFLLYVFRELNE